MKQRREKRRPSGTVAALFAVFTVIGLASSVAAAPGDPQWRNQTQEKQLVERGGNNTLKAEGLDEVNLTEAILSTNETGTFENKTENYSSPKELNSQDSWTWTNFTWRNTSLSGENVAWRIYYGDEDGNFTSTDMETFEVASTELEQLSLTSNTSGAQVSVFNSSGDLVSSGSSVTEKLASDELYDVKINRSTYLGVQWTRIRGLNLTSPVNVTSQLEVNYTGEKPPSTDIRTPVYAQEETGLEKENVTVRLPKNGSVNSILHCTDWSSSSSSCSAWEINSTADYSPDISQDYIKFNVSRFDAYAAGQTGPLPNVTGLKIYDVTGQQDKTSGGSLEAEGLNKRFNLSQKQENRSYRFNFTVVNDGLQNWEINSSDELFHSGLSTNWTLEQAWYDTPGGNFTGGSLSSGTISWNTSKGGLLEYQHTNDTMYASYVVEISQNESEAFDQRFEVNDTSENAGSFDEHVLDVTKYGFLDVNLTEPPSDTMLQQYDFFVMNATVSCRDGECGEVSVSARYNNSSSSADTLIPEVQASPFYTEGPNMVICDSGLYSGEECFYNWSVNASGGLDSEHILDVNASSSYPEVSSVDSSDSQVRIDRPVLVNVTWDTIDFGVLNPGVSDKPAEGNSNRLYNVSIPEESQTVDDLWVRAENLTAPGWGPSTGEKYSIPAENIFYDRAGTVEDKNPLSNSYQRMNSDLGPGTLFTTYYWIDVPTGLKNSTYTGNIYFKANVTN